MSASNSPQLDELLSELVVGLRAHVLGEFGHLHIAAEGH